MEGGSDKLLEWRMVKILKGIDEPIGSTSPE
jgi:hypothetical protein